MTAMTQLLENLSLDPWRQATGFSNEMDVANRALWSNPGDSATSSVILDWIYHHQPCKFGSIAAKTGQLALCVLNEEELKRGDEFVRGRIQQARLDWTRRGFLGQVSGFVIVVVSERIALARPDDAMLDLAQRLASLYLLEEVAVDRIYHDRIWLQMPGHDALTWEWKVGANYFCAQGDGRWWHDHRFPGGVALSMNSVGHFVKSGALSRAMAEVERSLGIDPGTWPALKIDSLERALTLAMQTIASAEPVPHSGPATALRPRGADSEACPVELPPKLSGYDHCGYTGYYHTDYTVPREYFAEDVKRSTEIVPLDLDFTYLFNKSVENPDHETMGAGRPVRSDGESDEQSEAERGAGVVRRVDRCPRLAEALA